MVLAPCAVKIVRDRVSRSVAFIAKPHPSGARERPASPRVGVDNTRCIDLKAQIAVPGWQPAPDFAKLAALVWP